MIGYLLRAAVTWLLGSRCWAPRCGRVQIDSPSHWCRIHTDAILFGDGPLVPGSIHLFPEVAERLEGMNVDLLQAEVELARQIRLVRHLRTYPIEGGRVA